MNLFPSDGGISTTFHFTRYPLQPIYDPELHICDYENWQTAMACFYQPVMVSGDRWEDPHCDRRDVVNVKKVVVQKVKV